MMLTFVRRPRPRAWLLLGALLAAATTAACSDATGVVDGAPPPDGRGPDAFAGCPLVVNEVAAAGEPDDWFELLNVSAAPVDLAGFVFTDDADEPSRGAPLPGTILAPGARHVQDVTDAEQGFQLGGDDALWLFRVGTTTHCDGVDWGSGDSPAGGSYSRIPDGTGDFETTEPDTRGVRNR